MRTFNLSAAKSKAITALRGIKSNEVAEALIATWCVEYLRARRIGGLNVVEIVLISALMLGVKTVVLEASRRRTNAKAIIVSGRHSRMGTMEIREYPARTS